MSFAVGGRPGLRFLLPSYLAAMKKKLNPTMRQRHRAGEKTFVDFSGKKPHIVDPKTGELVEMELFVGTLGASSYTYVEATLNQSLESWAKAHKGMSDYFGGSTEIWVPDNLKSGVDLVDRYEPGINRTYEELATHYGAVVVPARVFKPKDKAKVESAVQVAQRWILAVLRHRTFFSLAELNEAIWEKLEVLNARPMSPRAWSEPHPDLTCLGCQPCIYAWHKGGSLRCTAK